MPSWRRFISCMWLRSRSHLGAMAYCDADVMNLEKVRVRYCGGVDR